MDLNGELELKFAAEFKTQWTAYKELQTAVINGEAPIPKQNLQNSFNDGV